ncbi:hypothetical protein Pelo_9175 [Pelomyxa schiedti]|nr:hypothetical protein Pelo_9175 [Pelomyxa schiedti]
MAPPSLVESARDVLERLASMEPVTSSSFNSSSVDGGFFTESQTETLIALTITGATLSVIACSTVITLGIISPVLRQYKSRLIVWLAAWDLVPACAKLGSLLKKTNLGPWCQAMGFLENAGCLTSIAWPMMIAFAMYMMVVHHSDPRARWWLNEFFLMAIAATPNFAISIAVFFTAGYGSEGIEPWCWILGPTSFYYFYPLCWFYIGVNIFLYFLVTRFFFKKIYRINPREEKKQKRKSDTINTLMYLAPFPLVVSLTWVCPALHRIYRLITGEESFVLAVLHSLCDPTSGLINSTTYSITYFSEIKSIFANICKKPLTPAEIPLTVEFDKGLVTSDTPDSSNYTPPPLVINSEVTIN